MTVKWQSGGETYVGERHTAPSVDMIEIVESSRTSWGFIGSHLPAFRSLQIGAAIVLECDPWNVLAEQEGDAITIVFQRRCGHVGLAQFNASEVHGINRQFESLKMVEMPCYCMQPSEYR